MEALGLLELLLLLLRWSMPIRICFPFASPLSIAGPTPDAALSRVWQQWVSCLEGRAGSMQ